MTARIGVAGRPAQDEIGRPVTGSLSTTPDTHAPLPHALALAALARRALTELPLGALLHEAAPLAAQELGVPLLGIWQVLPGGGTLCLSAGSGWPEHLLGWATIAVEDRTPECAALLGKVPVLVGDLRADRRFTPAPLLGELGVASAALVAIPGEGHPLGVLAAYDRQPHGFDAAEIACLREIAAILGAAQRRRQATAALSDATSDLEVILQRAAIEARTMHPDEYATQPTLATPAGPDYSTEEALRYELRSSQRRGYELMEERLAERTRQLTAIYAITATASAPLSVDALLEQALDLTLGVAGTAAGAIHIFDEPQEPSRWLVQRGLPRAEQARTIGGTAVGTWLLEHDTPLLVRDTSVDPRTAGAAWLPRGQAYGAFPIHARGQIRGMLGVARAWGRSFTEDEARLLASIADQLGVAVENARLFAEVQQRAAHEIRRALSRDLHDSLTQSLYSLTLLAEVTQRQLRDGDRAQIDQYLGQLGETARQAMKEMRLLIHELRAAPLVDESLADALERRLDAVERRAGVRAHLQVETAGDLPVGARTELFQIAQEALNNVLKHAAATHVLVRLRELGGELELSIADDGRGFDPHRPLKRGGTGLSSMRERAAEVGGTVAIEPGESGGTQVIVRVPLAQFARKVTGTLKGGR